MSKKYTCRMERTIEIIEEFNSLIWSDAKTITECDADGNPIPETTRQVTDKDRLNFIQDVWATAMNELEELGIELSDVPEVTL